MKLTREVIDVRFSGKFKDVARQVGEFEDAFQFVPFTEPEIPDLFALVNFYHRDQKELKAIDPDAEGVMYAPASPYYRLLKAEDTLRLLVGAMEENSHKKFLASAYLGRHISVSVKEEGAEDPAIFYVNSYDKTLRESVILAPVMLKMDFVHRKSGKTKNGFDSVLDYLRDSLDYSEALTAMADVEVSPRDFTRFLNKADIPRKKLLNRMFGVEWEQIREIDEGQEDAEIFDYMRRTYDGDSLVQLVRFAHDLYRFFIQNTSNDKASKAVDRLSTFISKHYLKPLNMAQFL